jgi:hypothetical protein
MNRIAGLLLLASGGYLFYYWARLRFGDTATVADDPIVSFGVRFSGQARNFADGNGSLILVVAVPAPRNLCGNDPARAHRTGACALGRRLQRRQERRTETPTVDVRSGIDDERRARSAAIDGPEGRWPAALAVQHPLA